MIKLTSKSITLAAGVITLATLSTAPSTAQAGERPDVGAHPTRAVSTTAATARTAAHSERTAAPHRWPWMSVGLTHSMRGRTLTYRYSEVGYQYLVSDAGPKSSPRNNGESAGYSIDFGDHTAPDGGNGLGDAACRTSGPVARFSAMTQIASTHRYARPGRYTVTVTGYYCGTRPDAHVVHRYTVTAR